MTEIASFVFREENMQFAVHGNKSKFDLIQMKLELILNQIKNENSRFMERHPNQLTEFSKVNHHQLFFKSPLAVNNCIESMKGPNC
jgi:hypothetical protein